MEGDKRGERRGSPDKLSKVGIEGPKMSVSKIPARWPSLARARVRLTVVFPAPSEYLINFSKCQRGETENVPAIVLFPTPPFADETAITLRTSLIRRLSGRPRWRRGRN